ncbi:MAG: restriction endonuclease subunit S [Bacilli bacterium]|nr:restriction endonuclease subunit S [Bacilli bacterium]
MLGKVDALLNKKLEEVEWGNYRLDELFESSNGDFDIQRSHINGVGDYVITAGLTDNGIMGKTDVRAKIHDENTITVDMFGFAFYRQFKYKLVTHARVFSLKPNFKITENQGLFLTNSLFFLNKKFGYENMCSWTKIRKEKIQLPIKNGEIDFEFMESFITELEINHIAELDAYLLAAGLKDYTLTTEEQQILEDFEQGIIEFNEFKIGELFEINSYKKRFDANKVIISEVGKPYVVRTSLNNGIRGYIEEDERFLNEGNTISFGQDTATMFYQEKPYFTGDKIKIVKSKDNRFGKRNALFFVTAMSKSFSSFKWGSSSFSVNTIENQLVKIPTKNKQPDYKTMETFISAIQKLIIKEVVLYTGRKISTTKDIVNKRK